MESIISNKKSLENFIKLKYPKFKCLDFETDKISKIKLEYFNDVLNKEEPISICFIDYCTKYLNKNHSEYVTSELIEDVLNISIIFAKDVDKIASLPYAYTKEYLNIVRTKSTSEIKALNKIIYTKETIEKLLDLKNKSFKTEEEYMNYLNSIFSPAIFRYKLLKDSGKEKTEAAAEIREQIEITISTAIENSKNPIQLGLRRVLKPKNNELPLM